MSEFAPAAAASVVIPAYNEAAVIGRCLSALRAEGLPLEIVVAANGCSDDTAALARAVEGVTVLDIPTGSKSGALNAGDDAARAFPRIYLDADIELSPGALSGLVAALSADEPRVAAPRVLFDTRDASGWVRAYYRVFEELPYAGDGLVGLGVYGVSGPGRSRFERFPRVQADDLFIQRLFAPEERIRTEGTFTVRVPRKLGALVAVRTRVARGNAELATIDAASAQAAAGPRAFAATTGGTGRALATLLARHPARLPDVAVYVAVTVVARLRARRSAGSPTWNRDETTR